MSESDRQELVHQRIDQVLEVLARLSFGEFDVRVPALPDEDAFAEVFTALELVAADLRDAWGELQAQVRARTRELEADIRQREAVEARLRASEATYRMLVETSPDPILLCDLDDRIRMVNPALLRALGVDAAAELLGVSWFDLVVSEERTLVAGCAGRLECGVGGDEVEVRLRRRDGGQLVGALRCTVVRDAAGEPAGRLIVVHDVTARRRREVAQLRAQQLESLGTLAGGIAHDFNNCLTVIIGCLSLVREQLRGQPEAQHLLEGAGDAALRASALTRQLLTFAKGGTPVKSCLLIGDLVERVADFCVRGSNVRCDVRVEADLWPVEVDPGQLEQVVGNLVINAKQAMPDGGTVMVEVGNASRAPLDGSGEAGRYVCVTVEDSGVGIPPEDLRRIFDPYFTTKAGGTGLGLATAYSVVHRHGGLIECDSTVGQGSRFRVLIPASARRPDPAPPAAPSPRRGQGRILVMDDEALVREVAARQLADAGYEVEVVASGAAALSAYRDARDRGDPFDAALMDLTVPGGDGGKETIPKLLALDPAARCIVVSGYSDDPVLANYREYGFRARLAKPFRSEQLLHVLAAVLEEGR